MALFAAKSEVEVDVEPIERVADGQHGVVERGQALDRGVPARTLEHWASAGRLQRVHPGVYRVAGAPRIWEQQVLAAVLAAGDGALASHRTAARLWGMRDGDRVEITVPRPRQPRLRGVLVHQSRDVGPEWASRRRNVPVTNPLMTLVDLGAVLSARQVEDAVDRALVARLVTVAGLEGATERLRRPGRRGAGVLRRILDERALGADRPDSLLEPRMARLLRDAGLPPAVFQYEVGDGRRRMRVDFAYPALRVAIEVDGLEVHGTARALQADLDRQNALVALGWTVVRFTWLDVVRRPEKVARTIRRLLPPAAVA